MFIVINKILLRLLNKSFFIVNFRERRTYNMGTIKENYEMMFTSYPDLVDINQLKE